MIDSESMIPLYEQVSNKIHEKILRGELKPGARIGSINELIKEYHVSRVTAINAIEDMVKKGFAVSRQGKGTFVKEAYIGDELLSLRSFNEISVEGHSSIIRFERTELPEKLQSTFDGETERLLIHRLQFFKDSPIGLIEITLPWSVAEKVNPARTQLEHSSMFDVLQNGGVNVKTAKQVISASGASKETARLLGLNEGAPILLATRTSYDEKGRAVMFSTFFYRSDSYSYTVTLNRNK